ncbi:MAG: DMT family transporter [Clostridia bacterium]|nr:DMT family transporter [Clostridia bacterium]
MQNLNTTNKISDKTKGIICLLLSALSFAVMSLFVNLSGDMPVWQKAFFRNIVAVVISLSLLFKSKEGFKIKKSSLPGLFMRATFGTIGILANFYAISKINIADALILNKMSPFFAIIASIFVLNERATLKQWLTVFVAFIGSLFVVKPAFIISIINGTEIAGGGEFPAIIGLVGGVSAGIAYTFLRKVKLNGERGNVVVAFFSIFSCLVLMPFIFFTYQPITKFQLLMLLGAGVSACCGQITITAAYGYCPAKEISIYDYSTVIFAAILGFIFLQQIPDKWSILGYIIIILASLYSFIYNNRRK